MSVYNYQSYQPGVNDSQLNLQIIPNKRKQLTDDTLSVKIQKIMQNSLPPSFQNLDQFFDDDSQENRQCLNYDNNSPNFLRYYPFYTKPFVSYSDIHDSYIEYPQAQSFISNQKKTFDQEMTNISNQQEQEEKYFRMPCEYSLNTQKNPDFQSFKNLQKNLLLEKNVLSENNLKNVMKANLNYSLSLQNFDSQRLSQIMNEKNITATQLAIALHKRFPEEYEPTLRSLISKCGNNNSKGLSIKAYLAEAINEELSAEIFAVSENPSGNEKVIARENIDYMECLQFQKHMDFCGICYAILKKLINTPNYINRSCLDYLSQNSSATSRSTLIKLYKGKVKTAIPSLIRRIHAIFGTIPIVNEEFF